MATGEDWSTIEVEACVADYLKMLTLELSGQSYNKTKHRGALLPKLDGRTDGSIERKHRNISAVMIEFGYPYITGYKPLMNYQKSLRAVVEQQVSANVVLDSAALIAVEKPAIAPPLPSLADALVPIPVAKEGKRVAETPEIYAGRFSPFRRDYLERESQNRSLGSAGECFVLAFEAKRLHALGKRVLSERVEQVSKTQGDGLGYDVLSFDESGRERFIEVKTTSFGDLTPFYVSRNEMAFSESEPDQFHLYRVFDFRQKPKLFDLPGVISTHCNLDPVSYLARLT